MVHNLIQVDRVTGNVTINVPEPPPVQAQLIEGDIPQKPRGFQPRGDLLQQLHEQVSDDGTAVVSAVTGTLGVGKTLLAASYVWLSQKAGYPVIAWIAAETRDQLMAGMAALADRLGVRGPEDNAEAAAHNARNWLSGSSSPSLLVFDNATDLDQIRRWAPATGNVRVIVTSRNRAFHRLFAPVDVAVFTEAEAVAYLHRRTGLTDDQGAAELSGVLGGLPLALAQASAQVNRQRIGYQDYLVLHREFPLSDHLPSLSGDAYPFGTAEAILLSVLEAEASHVAARHTLELMAVLAPSGVPRELLDDAALADLADTSLISFSDDNSTVHMHRLIQRVLRERAQHEGRLDAAIVTATGLLETYQHRLPGGTAILATRASLRSLVEQIKSVHAFSPSERTLAMLASSSRRLTELADLPFATELAHEVLATRVNTLGPLHRDTLTSRYDLAVLYAAARQFDEAIQLLEHVRTEQEKILGTKHRDTLATGRALGHCYAHSTGRRAEAIPLLEQVTAACEQALGPDDPGTLASRDKLAWAYGIDGQGTRALSLYESTYDIARRSLGPEYEDTLEYQNTLAHAYAFGGAQPGKAIELYENTLSVRTRTLGPDHPRTLDARNRLGQALAKAGDADLAIAEFEETLTARTRVLGPDHPDTVRSQSDLGAALVNAWAPQDAIEQLQAALATAERVLEPDDPDTLTIRNRLALAHHAAGHDSTAIELLQRNLEEAQWIFADDGEYIEHFRHTLHQIDYESSGIYSAAIGPYERAQWLENQARQRAEQPPAPTKPPARWWRRKR
ncbi:FxSxx-COOH system tetratricopeptide repeat protein [Streptomyces sp. NPDC090499]|uniref:FxSxx-COOH system tetratricopeptide repeat protein n=1 Tax=Streptomyces sp. NPDC090499 TaxID=3365965 RepID=UPI003828E1FD